MASRSALEDPQARDLVVAHLTAGGTLEQAAQLLGCSRRALRKYAEAHPEFEARLEAARQRRTVAVERLPSIAKPRAKPAEPDPEEAQQAATALGVQVELVRDADAAPGCTAAELLELCWAVANDPFHRAAGQALRILAEFKLGPVVRAQQRAEARAEAAAMAGPSEGVVMVRLPVNGTEAPGREPVILDAEVVER